MSVWSSVLPGPALGSLALLYVPGLLCVMGIGVRGFSRWLLAPLWSAGTLLLASLLLSVAGIPFSLGAVLFVQLGCVIVCLLLRPLLGRWSRTPVIPTPGDVGDTRTSSRFLWGTTFGVIVVLNAVIMWWRSFGAFPPEQPPQQNDALYHNSGVWSILHSGDASPLEAFTRMYGPAPVPVVYPNVFHQFVALIAEPDTVIASTKIFLFGICVVWLVGVAGLSRAALPTVRWAPWIAICLAQFHPSFPVYLMNRVTIWPNTLGIALLPGLLAVIIVTVRRLHARPQRALREIAPPLLIILPAGAGLAGAYPSVYFATVVVLGGLAIGAAHMLPASRWLPNGAWMRGVVIGAPFAVALFAPLLLSPRLRDGFLEWHDTDPGEPLFTVWSLLMQYPAGGGNLPFRLTLLIYAILTTVGAVRALRTGALRSVAMAWLAVFLFTVATVLPLFPLTHVTSVWYYGIYRLVPYTLMLSIPLVIRELVLMASAASRALPREVDVTSHLGRTGMAGLLTLSMIGAAVLTDVARVRDQNALFAPARTAPTYMLDQEELAMMQRLPDRVDPGAWVIGTPSSGAAYLPSYVGIDVVYRQNGFGTAIGPGSDGIYLSENFHDIHTDPNICALLEKYGIRYYYADVDRIYHQELQSEKTPGLYDVATEIGFELIDRGGSARVYEITACDGELPSRLPPVSLDTVPDTDG